MCLMKSLASRGHVRVTFSWQYNYCYLTDAGIEYLRTYLALPSEIVPATHKATARRPDSRDREDEKVAPGGRPAFNDRGGGFGRGA